MQTLIDELNVVKDKLQQMTIHWRQEWKDAVTKWSSKFKITRNETIDWITFPTDVGFDYCLIACNQKSINFNIATAISYKDHFASKYLDKVPINLVVDIFRHFVLAFGGEFDTQNAVSNKDFDRYFDQWLRVDEENKRHRKIIHTVMSEADHGFDNIVLSTSTASITLLASSIAPVDDWEMVSMREIQLGGKLLADHYIGELLTSLRSHQVARMIECYFHRVDHSIDSKKMIKTAKKFQSVLYFQVPYGIYVNLGNYLPLIEINTVNSETSDNREAMKDFNLENKKDSNNSNNYRMKHFWDELLKNPRFAASLSYEDSEKLVLLTSADVQFIVCCHIDAHYDREELLAKTRKINKMNSKSSELTATFPSLADDFSNFDPPHLRGTLAESVLSRKLAKYALGEEEIGAGNFAAVAPSALVDIVSSYYSVDNS